jgi:Big-like domain-containing protein
VHTLDVGASADPNVPSTPGTTASDTGTRRTVNRVMVAGSTGTAVLINVTLMRYAIDLVAPLCLVALLPRSIRDGIGDWFSGEKYKDGPDPLWAVCVIVVHLVATAVSIIWIFSTSSWLTSPRIENWIPGAIVRVASVGEAHGWGRRAIMTDPRRRTDDRVAGPAAARNDASSTPKGTGLLGSASQRPEHARAGTAGQDAQTPPDRKPERPSDRQPEQPEPSVTTITLVSSVPVVRAGSGIQLTATVTAAGARPQGAVRFLRGGAMLGSVQVDQGGRAVLSVTDLPPGEHTVTAEFSGSARFRPSRSQTTVLCVTP